MSLNIQKISSSSGGFDHRFLPRKERVATRSYTLAQREAAARHKETGSSSITQPSLMGRATVATSSGLRLQFRFFRNSTVAVQSQRSEEQPPQKRRRIESESHKSLIVTPEVEFEDEELSSSINSEALAMSSSNPLLVEETQERVLPIDEEDSLLLGVLARAANVAGLKEMVNVDFEQFKRLVRSELESQDKLSDVEQRNLFLDAVRKCAFHAVLFLLEESSVAPRTQVEGAREALRAGNGWLAIGIMIFGTMGPENEVEQFLEEAASMGRSNVIRVAVMKGLMTDASANKILDVLKCNSDPQAIASLRSYFQGIHQYRRFAASLQ